MVTHEIDPQPLGDAKYPLTMGDRFQDIGKQPLTVFHDSFLMARGTQVAPLARVAHQEFMTALAAFDPCETALQIAAIQIAIDDVHYIRPPEPETGSVPIFPDLLKLFEVGFYALIVGAGAGVARAIDVLRAASIGC